MLLKFFRKSHLIVVITILAILVAIWLRTFIKGLTYPFIFDSISMPLYSLAVKLISPATFYSRVITVLLVVTITFYLLHINSKFIIIKQRTYLPILVFIVVSSAFIPVQRINPAIFASLFIIIALNHIFTSYQKENPLDNLFRAGLMLGIASLFYAPAGVMYSILFIGLSMLRPFNAREWIVSILGITVPWGFLIFTYYWLDIDISALVNMVKNNLITGTTSSIAESIPIVFTILIGIPTLVALLYLIPSMSAQKISVRKYQNILLWLLLLCAFSFVVIPTCSYEIAYIGAIPLSYQLTSYFSSAKGKFWPEVLFILLFVAVLVIQIFPLG